MMHPTPIRGPVVGTGLGLALVVGSAVALAGSEPAAGRVSLESVRSIAIDDGQILSMSPDGSSFVASEPMRGGPHGRLCVYDLATASPTACADLSGLDAGLTPESVAWSPDADHLTFTEAHVFTQRDGDLWLMDSLTGELTNLDDDGYVGGFGPTAPVGTSQDRITLPSDPVFTPDGTAVTYSRSWIREGRPAGEERATVAVEGGEPRPLVRVSEDEIVVAYLGKAWTADGKRLYYSVHHQRLGDERNGIWTVADDGSGNRHVVAPFLEDGAGPAVQQLDPDGSLILAYDPVLVVPGGGDAYALADTGSGQATVVAPPSEARGEHSAVELAGLSPDGRALVMVLSGTDPDHQVWVRDLVTSEELVLVPKGLEASGAVIRGLPASWSTDDTILVPGGGTPGTATLLTLG
jgi:Tol biopolymer transport system component